MIFLSLNDLHVIIRAERLQQVIDDDPTILAEAEAGAIAIVKDALSGRYDTTNIFDSLDKPEQVKRWVRNIMVYDIANRLPEKSVGERIVKNYDDTLQTLTDIEEGRKNTNLPLKSELDTEGVGHTKTVLRWGSNHKRNHRF